jgi:hypothetical protein
MLVVRRKPNCEAGTERALKIVTKQHHGCSGGTSYSVPYWWWWWCYSTSYDTTTILFRVVRTHRHLHSSFVLVEACYTCYSVNLFANDDTTSTCVVRLIWAHAFPNNTELSRT